MAENSSNTVMPKLLGEWNTNARLRWGTYVLLAIFWLYAILILRDAVGAAQSNWDAMEARNARARSTAAEADWPIRAQEIKSALTDLEALLWRDGSIGLSQAAFEERIAQSLAASGITVRSLRASAVADGAATSAQLGLIPLRARVQVDFRPASIYPWMATLSRSKSEKSPTLVIEALTIRPANFGQPATADIEIVGYALKPGDGNPGSTK